MILPGRQPTLEALRHPGIDVQKVLVATTARGHDVDTVTDLAAACNVPVETVADRRLSSMTDERLHQGVACVIEPPILPSPQSWLDERKGRNWETSVLVLDSVHNPANVGLILRTAAGAGVDAVFLPRVGTAEIGPLTVKAGSGMIFAVKIIETETTIEALDLLGAASFELCGLDAGGEDLFSLSLPSRGAYVLGNETSGISGEVRNRLDRIVSLPLANGVESLNVAAAAAVVSYDIARRRNPR